MNQFSYILATCETGNEDFIISSVKKIPGVRNVSGTFGTYDLIIQLDKTDRNDIISIVNQIRNINHVRSTLTLIGNEGIDYFKKLDSKEYETINQHMAQAHVLINCRKGSEKSILEQLSNIPEVIDGNAILGPFDAIIHVVAPSYNEISDIVTKRIRKLQDIKSTNTLNLIPRILE